MTDNSVNSDNSVWSIVIDNVLVSSVQQSESVIHTHLIFFKVLFSQKSLQTTE